MNLKLTMKNAVVVWNFKTGRMIVRDVEINSDKATWGDLAKVQGQLGLEPEDPNWVHIQNLKLEVQVEVAEQNAKRKGSSR